MGQSLASSVEFKDNWSASKVSSRGRITCKKSCSFTQYSTKEFSTACESGVTCKIHESNYDMIAFGLVPEHQTKACRNNIVGDSEIFGSIGCRVTRNSVKLVKGDKTFFEGTYHAGNSFSITMHIRNGTLSYFVDGSKVNSDELEAMAFHGSYKLGVSMVTEGQMAEVFFTCPVTFADVWSAGDVNREMLSAKKSTNFTFYSEQVISPEGHHKIAAVVLRNCDNSVGLGTLPVDCQEICRNELVGMTSGTLGCLFKDGSIIVVVKGDVVFAAEVNTADPCELVMCINNGQISFEFDGKEVDCDELKSIRLTGDFRVGLALSAQGQLVEMRGDGKLGHPVSTPSSGRSKDELVDKLIDLLVDGLRAGSSDSGELRWKDNMKSVDCDDSDRIAVCVKKFTATLHSQRVVNASGNESIDIRILSLKPDQLMMLGVMDEDTKNHSNHHLGASGLSNSLGLTSRGDLLVNGSTKATGRGFNAGDLVSLLFDNGNLSIKVNGREAVPEVGDLSFKSKFRWAVSFTQVGQAIKIGSGDLTQGELSFCQSKGVVSPSVEPPSSPSSFSACSTTLNTTMSSIQTVGSAKSYDSAIMGCHIDIADLTYGGKSLGEGSFGKVFVGKWDDSDVAIKEIPWDDDDCQRREIAVGRSLTQPNIATIMGWSRKDNTLLVVMPLFRKGSLADRLSKVDDSAQPSPSSGGHFGFAFTFKIGIGLLRAIKYMATREPNPLIHRDIKPANVLLDDNDQPMLTDFGTARSIDKTFATTGVGTPFYMAAEQATNEGASTATDVHAVALVIYEVLCVPRKARQSTSVFALMTEIAGGRAPPMDDVPGDIARILEPAYTANPHHRPTAAQMLASFEKVRPQFQ